MPTEQEIKDFRQSLQSWIDGEDMEGGIDENQKLKRQEAAEIIVEVYCDMDNPYLNLSELDLTSLPPQICNLTSLTHLHLNNNQLQTLPAEIGNLSLTHLHLSYNQFQTLPPEICDIASLTYLGLISNGLRTLPPEICDITSLTQLKLDNNQLQTLPAEIGNLTSLISLDLTNNQLQTLPPEIGNLTSLKSLYLFANQLQILPDSLFTLQNCQINAKYNQFSAEEVERLNGLARSSSGLDLTVSIYEPEVIQPQVLEEERAKAEDVGAPSFTTKDPYGSGVVPGHEKQR